MLILSNLAHKLSSFAFPSPQTSNFFELFVNSITPKIKKTTRLPNIENIDKRTLYNCIPVRLL